MRSGEASPSSFRDPDGYIFKREGRIFRKVNPSGVPDWTLLNDSGLLDHLVGRGLALPVAHVESSDEGVILEPEMVPIISYPWEWSFGQLKDAALTTLQIAEAALDRGMMLKDATAFNIQFLRGRPVHIDTLSFEAYEEGRPWVAYRQFCEHFLAPLALMSHVDVRLSSLLRSHLEGIPLDLASKMLPGKTKFSLGLGAHIHAHARAMSHSGGGGRSASFSATALKALLANLNSTVESLSWEPVGTTWASYYSETNYPDSAMAEKMKIVRQWTQGISPHGVCWDLGANDGTFSRITAENGLATVAWDLDPAAVELAYRWVKRTRSENLLPLLQDLANPTPAQGWDGRERDSFFERGPVDMMLALALIHHLAIGRNVPLGMIAAAFARMGRTVIVEFVPKEDSQVQRMLAGRKDVFADYHEAEFQRAFHTHFDLIDSHVIAGTKRRLFLWKKR